MTSGELQVVLHRLDPAKHPEEVQQIISKAFSIPLEQAGLQLEGAEQQGMATPTSKIVEKLNQIGTSRSGPKS